MSILVSCFTECRCVLVLVVQRLVSGRLREGVVRSLSFPFPCHPCPCLYQN